MTGRPTLLDRTLANIASETLLPMVRPGAPPNVHGGASREGAAPGSGATSLRIASAQSVPVGFKPVPSLRSARASVSAYTGPRRPTHHLSIVEGAALMRDVDEALQRVRGERVASTGCGLEALGHAHCAVWPDRGHLERRRGGSSAGRRGLLRFERRRQQTGGDDGAKAGAHLVSPPPARRACCSAAAPSMPPMPIDSTAVLGTS